MLRFLDEIQYRLDELEKRISLHETNQETYTYCTIEERKFLDELKEIGEFKYNGLYDIEANTYFCYLDPKCFKVDIKEVFGGN